MTATVQKVGVVELFTVPATLSRDASWLPATYKSILQPDMDLIHNFVQWQCEDLLNVQCGNDVGSKGVIVIPWVIKTPLAARCQTFS